MEAHSLTGMVFSPGTGTWRLTHLLELFFLQVLVHVGGQTYLNCFFSSYWYMVMGPLT